MAQRLRALSWKKIWAQFPAPPWQPTTVHYSSFKGSYYVCPLWAPEPFVMHRHTFEKNTHIHKILKHFKGFLLKRGRGVHMSACMHMHAQVCMWMCASEGCVHGGQRGHQVPWNWHYRWLWMPNLCAQNYKEFLLHLGLHVGRAWLSCAARPQWAMCICHQTRKTGRPCSSCQNARAYSHHWSINSNWS